MNWTLIGLAAPWIIVVLGCWLGYQLLRQNGRILLRLEALEERLAQAQRMPASPRAAPVPSLPVGLPLGSPAPDFALPGLDGSRKALAEFRGKRQLLVLFNPSCGFCIRMAGDLAALPVDGADGRPVPLVVSTGNAEANRRLVEEHGIRCPVLLQEQMEVAARYQAYGTPMGYLIDEQGQIASEIAMGADALLALAEGRVATAGVNGNGHHARRGNRDLADSKIQRNGLAAGTPAPTFALPRVEGGELSLEELRGRRVLLIFSDPKCGPCMALAPQLEQAHRQSDDVQVLMVSRGDVEANRAKVAEFGLTFPVVLQRQWEISRQYAMFATPVGYLIDEAGVVVSEVATGVDAILALLPGAAEQRCRCGRRLEGCDCGNGRRNRLGPGSDR
jgi:peroxiredoxin